LHFESTANAVVLCAIIACNTLQLLHVIIAGFQNVFENIHEPEVLQPMTAFGGITRRIVLVLPLEQGTHP